MLISQDKLTGFAKKGMLFPMVVLESCSSDPMLTTSDDFGQIINAFDATDENCLATKSCPRDMIGKIYASDEGGLSTMGNIDYQISSTSTHYLH